MTSLDLAHELGYVSVIRLSDGRGGQLDPPEPSMSASRPNSPSLQEVFSGWTDSADADPWSQPPLAEPIGTVHRSFEPGAGQERLLASMSSRLEQVSGCRTTRLPPYDRAYTDPYPRGVA